jgi:hypothetical protein
MPKHPNANYGPFPHARDRGFGVRRSAGWEAGPVKRFANGMCVARGKGGREAVARLAAGHEPVEERPGLWC